MPPWSKKVKPQDPRLTRVPLCLHYEQFIHPKCDQNAMHGRRPGLAPSKWETIYMDKQQRNKVFDQQRRINSPSSISSNMAAPKTKCGTVTEHADWPSASATAYPPAHDTAAYPPAHDEHWPAASAGPSKWEKIYLDKQQRNKLFDQQRGINSPSSSRSSMAAPKSKCGTVTEHADWPSASATAAHDTAAYSPAHDTAAYPPAHDEHWLAASAAAYPPAHGAAAYPPAHDAASVKEKGDESAYADVQAEGDRNHMEVDDERMIELASKMEDFFIVCCKHYVVQTGISARMNRMILLRSF